MAAESAALTEPHRDGVKNPAEQLQDVPLVVTSHKPRPQRPLSVAAPAANKKPLTMTMAKGTSEKTPLVLKIDTSRHSQSIEEVHPLPWFRSPEWSRRQSPLLNKDRGAARQKRGRGRGAVASPSGRWWCFGSNTTHARDVELGYSSSHRRALGTATTNDADGFRQCIQFLVGLIIVVALALIFMIIFEPFQESSATAAAAVAASEGDGGW